MQLPGGDNVVVSNEILAGVVCLGKRANSNHVIDNVCVYYTVILGLLNLYSPH